MGKARESFVGSSSTSQATIVGAGHRPIMSWVSTDLDLPFSINLARALI